MNFEIFAAVCAVEAPQAELSSTDESWTGQGSFKHRDD